MTGLHPGHAYIRNNRSVPPEGQFPIPAETVTLGKLLHQQGYVSGAFGKWGLGPPASSGDPLRQGFDRFFGFNCQAVAHNLSADVSETRDVSADHPGVVAQLEAIMQAQHRPSVEFPLPGVDARQ